jgi:purine-binding chemotaxis protein CheW
MNTAETMQAVIFRLGEESFALPVGLVREILDYRAACRLPGAPAWLMGLIDVRGQSVPIADLRLRLGMEPAQVGLSTRVLVVELPRGGRDGQTLVLGLVVDRVLDVSNFTAQATEHRPDIGTAWRDDIIEAVMRDEQGFVLLLNIFTVLVGAELGDLTAYGQAA